MENYKCLSLKTLKSNGLLTEGEAWQYVVKEDNGIRIRRNGCFPRSTIRKC